MSTHDHHNEEHGAARGTVTSYVAGYALSSLLTLTIFALIEIHFQSGHRIFSHEFLYATLVVCAIVQLFAQLFFFLHMGRGSKPRWNLIALVFAFIVVGILVVGTLWIMYNLQRNMEPTQFINGVITPQTEND